MNPMKKKKKKKEKKNLCTVWSHQLPLSSFPTSAIVDFGSCTVKHNFASDSPPTHHSVMLNSILELSRVIWKRRMSSPHDTVGRLWIDR